MSMSHYSTRNFNCTEDVRHLQSNSARMQHLPKMQATFHQWSDQPSRELQFAALQHQQRAVHHGR